ncbi:C-type natriuretic peptide 4-like [Electrophorus electricus]|uniref:C-type natriuretic peptide 4-like n=1 Tax=Electrophorus electricus TaxID=8005 RepID=UPI000F0A2175|nr:C-type natriuretic peptide 4-like [Electrophorus electricus]
MDLSYLLMCGMLVTLCLRPSAIPLTTAQDKVSASSFSLLRLVKERTGSASGERVMRTAQAANRSVTPTLNDTDVRSRGNGSRALHEPNVANRVKLTKLRQSSDQSRARKKQPSNKSERRKNCFGFKMDRISDLSGMGCKSD